MNRRSFIESLIAGAAVVMLPSLAKASETVFEFPMNTVADLTAWMEHRFNCSSMEPQAYVEHKAEDLPKLYGFSASDIPALGHLDILRITPMVVAYACEGGTPKEAEARLVQAVYEKFTELAAGTPILWRVEPRFETHQMVEYGDTWMTREQVEDRTDLNEEFTREFSGKLSTYVRRMPYSPLQIPEGVEEDFDTGHFKYVKNKYQLHKLRMRIAMPTAPYDYINAVKVAEGSRTQRIHNGN